MKNIRHIHDQRITAELPAIHIVETNKQKQHKVRRALAATALTAATVFGIGSYVSGELAAHANDVHEIDYDEIANTWEGKFDWGEGGAEAFIETLEENGIDINELNVSVTHEGQQLQELYKDAMPNAGDRFLVHQMNDGEFEFEKLDK